jgi:hypothetical protein
MQTVILWVWDYLYEAEMDGALEGFREKRGVMVVVS